MLNQTQAMMPFKTRAMPYRKTTGNALWLPLLLTGRTQKLKMLYFLLVCLVLFGGGLCSCSTSSPLGLGRLRLGAAGNVTKISDIAQNQNAGATVYLEGQVAILAPFLGSGAYKLQDSTGAIWVITNQTLPSAGDEVLIKGQLQFQSIAISGQELGEVYVQQQQMLQRRAGQPGQTVSPSP